MLFFAAFSALIVIGAVIFARISIPKLERFLFYVAGYFLGGDVQARTALLAPVDTLPKEGDLEGVVDEDTGLERVSPRSTFITSSGDLVTYVLVNGSRRYIGPKDFDSRAAKLAQHLQVPFVDGTGKQHAISVGFLSDPPGTKNVIKELLKPSRSTAIRMGAKESANIWFNKREEFLTDICRDEVAVLAFYTLVDGLSKREAERYGQWREEQGKKRAGKKLSRFKDELYAQPLLDAFPVMATRHKAGLNNFLSLIDNKDGGVEVSANILDCKTALYYLARFVNANGVPGNWRGQLFGDTAPTGTSKILKTDGADVLPIPIARQIFSAPMQEDFKSDECVFYDGYWYASLKMDMRPHEDPNPSFSSLADRIAGKFPYTATIEVLPDGMSYRQIEQTLAGILGGFGSHNKAVKAGWNELKAIRDSREDSIVGIRFVCTTWSKNKGELSDRLSEIKTALQSWGSAVVSNESGSPVNLLISSAPGLSRANPAPILPGPMSAATRMLPMFRPASPWRYGQLLLRTKDGRPYPFQFGAPNQDFWGTLIFAAPGKGKSFLMNSINSSIMFSAGKSELPYITIIDKGMSSACLVDMAQAILPELGSTQAVSIRLQNTAEYAINVFDTQHGLDMPTGREFDFQVNMISTLCPSLGDEGRDFISQVINEAYKNLKRGSLRSKIWQRALDHDITSRLEYEGMNFSDDTKPVRVWDVVDQLFDLGEIEMSVRAQRFAVPLFDDLITAAHSQVVKDLYKNKTIEGEPIVDVFERSITTASRGYAMLSTYTRFDIGNARVISIDLEDVLAGASSEEGRRRAAAMMLFARQLGARNYFLRWDEISHQTPERYAQYQKDRIKRISESVKILVYDEFHNARGMVDVQNQVATEFREARKYNIIPILASQRFEDFSEELIACTNNFFVLGASNARELAKIGDTLMLSESERQVIVNECLGPSAKGAPMFVQLQTNEGPVTQLLYNSACSLEKWAFNSSKIDSQLRQTLTEKLQGDYWKGLEILGRLFPAGTARYEVDRLQAGMSATEKENAAGILDTLAQRILAQEAKKGAV